MFFQINKIIATLVIGLLLVVQTALHLPLVVCVHLLFAVGWQFAVLILLFAILKDTITEQGDDNIAIVRCWHFSFISQLTHERNVTI